MKRTDLLRRLESYGCKVKRENDSHTLWRNPKTGQIQAVPQFTIFGKGLAQKVCLGLSVPPLE